MALVKGTNAYVTVVEADAYFSDRLDADAWSNADSTKKAQALITASLMLNDLEWAGTAVSGSQGLAFPRNGEFFDTRLGSTDVMDPVPKRIENACMEQAYHLLLNTGILDDTGSLDALAVSGINLSAIKAAERMSPLCNRLVKPLLENKGSNLWWRAN